MFSKKLFCVVAMLIGMVASFGAYAQNLTVRGTVKDATGPVVGAVVLSEDVEMLQEAVALGYGAQTKKKDLSASVGIVSNPEKLAGRPVTSTTAMLQGQVPGVVVSFSNGAPTSGPGILIRGQGSRNGDGVLWVVDGVPGGRFELPIGQFPTFQEAPDRTIRDADLLRQSQGFIGPYDSGAHGKLHRCRNDV